MIPYIRTAAPEKLRGTALLRLDFNTEDDWRMRAALPTVKFLLRYADKIVIVSHKGRPKGFDKKLSLHGDAKRLQKLLGRKIIFISKPDSSSARKTVITAPRKSILLLENLRFLHGEEKNDPRLAHMLASFSDYYVNDAFAVSHRANASVAAITNFLPSYAGLEMEQEIKFLSHVMDKAKRPLVVILGGGKAKDKLGVLKYFKNRAKYFILGGAAANTLLYLRGVHVGKSLIDKDASDLNRLKSVLNYKNVLLPFDWESEKEAILDIGEGSARFFAEKLAKGRTIIWSGPMGFIEKKKFSYGSLAVAKAIAANLKAFSIVGGGETVMFLKKYGLDKKFSFISTGGGALLEFLEGRKLPGIVALEHAAKGKQQHVKK
jgi:phosphoglycerate kinase